MWVLLQRGKGDSHRTDFEEAEIQGQSEKYSHEASVPTKVDVQ